MKIDFIDSIEKINKEDWESVLSSKYPFLKYEFLKALEVTNCVSPEQGWTPLHLIASENEKIMAIMPLYIKTDSQGEFIFDWSWADAYYRNGLNYYPKLLSKSPKKVISQVYIFFWPIKMKLKISPKKISA